MWINRNSYTKYVIATAEFCYIPKKDKYTHVWLDDTSFRIHCFGWRWLGLAYYNCFEVEDGT